MRLKESYFVNLPTYANKVMEFAMGVLNEKLKKRVIVSIILKCGIEFTLFFIIVLVLINLLFSLQINSSAEISRN